MWFMAEVSQNWITNLSTIAASVLGGGALSTMVTTYMNNRKGDKSDATKYLSDRVGELEKKNDILEEKDRKCNERVTMLEREAYRLRDRVLYLEDKLITAVVSADSNMRIISWNEGATLMFGYLAADMIGVDVDVLVPGYLKQRHHDAYEKAINDLDSVTNWTNARPVAGVHKDGHEFNIELIISSFRNTAGSKFFEARMSKPRAI